MNEQQKKSFILLIRLDAENILRSIVEKKHDYLMILNLQRTRKHFSALFESKYDTVGIGDLKELDESTLSIINNFYREVSELKWYLMHTQDLPAMIEGHTDREIKKLKALFTKMVDAFDFDPEIG